MAKQESKAEATTAAEMRGLWVVLPGKFLHVPRQVEGVDRVWARPGGIIDADDPFVRKSLEGQEYKLAKLPKGETGTVTVLPARMNALKQREERRKERKKELPPAAQKAVGAAAGAGIAVGIKPADDESGDGDPDATEPEKDPKAGAGKKA